MFSFSGFGPGNLSELFIGSLLLVEVQQSIIGVKVNLHEQVVQMIDHVIFFTDDRFSHLKSKELGHV
jgi:hypothetical protein